MNPVLVFFGGLLIPMVVLAVVSSRLNRTTGAAHDARGSNRAKNSHASAGDRGASHAARFDNQGPGGMP